MAGLFNEEELKRRFTPAEVAERAERYMGPYGFLDGSDQWFMWEAIRNLALAIAEVKE
jgi:hypothetical protein